MYVTLSEVKNLYNICLPDSRVSKSLLLAHDYFKRMVTIFEDVEASGQEQDQYVIELPTRRFLFDSDYDWQNSPADVTVFQYNAQTLVEQNVSGNVQEVRDFRQGSSHKLIVKFDQNIPTNTSDFPKLSFKFHLTPIDLREKRYEWFIKDYIAMYTLYNLLNTTDVSKLQTGVANWNLNGVTLSVDSTNIRSVMDDIKKKLDTMYNEFMPIVSGFMEGDVDTSSRYFGYDSTPGSGSSYSATIDRMRYR